MRKGFFLLLAVMLVTACGKNDNFRTVGGYYNQPYSPTYPYNPPNPQQNYPIQWQVPQGMPQQFQPFAPMYNYMQQNQQMAQYWNYLWYQWQMYSQQCGCPMYDFNTFWNDFCPQMWSGTSYSQVYQWYDQNVYYYY